MRLTAQGAALQKFTKHHNDLGHDIEVQHATGTGEFVGEADTREEAQRNYAKIIDDYEGRYPLRKHYTVGPRGDYYGGTLEGPLQRLREANTRAASEARAGSGLEGATIQGKAGKAKPRGAGKAEEAFRAGGVAKQRLIEITTL